MTQDVWLVVDENENDELFPVIAFTDRVTAQTIADRIGGKVIPLLVVDTTDE